MKRSALYCKAVALSYLPEFIRKLDREPEYFFGLAGLNMAHIKSNDFYDWDKACELLELAARELDAPSLGLQWALDIPNDFLNSGPMVLIGALMPTVRDSINLGLIYQKLHTNGVTYFCSQIEQNAEVEFEARIHPRSPPCRQFAEHILAIIVLMERYYLNEANFTKITFQHNAPKDISWHEKIFKCPVEFNSEKTAVYMPSSYLDVKMGGKLKALQPIVKMYLNRKLTKGTRFDTSIAQTVEQILPAVFGMRKSGQLAVANILDVSPKKLQRLLNDEGVTYSEILSNVRKNIARRLLIESDISISHLAVLLDYSSTESFNTACNRWFGVSPSQYRKKVRAPQD